MRRADKEVRERKEILAIMDRCSVVRLAMVDHGKPYLVPLHFGYQMEGEHLTLYLHSAAEGKKIEILRENPAVCFEMDCAVQTIRNEVPCKWSTNYESVIGSGEVEWIEKEAEKAVAMNTILKRYGLEGEAQLAQGALANTCVYKIAVQEIVGKRSPAQPQTP